MLDVLFNLDPHYPDARAPTKATEGSAAFDLYSASLHVTDECMTVDTGLRTAFPSDHVMLVFGRSGLARKYGISLRNGVAVIDSDYRGNIQLVFRYNDGSYHDAVENLLPGKRIAQALFVPIPQVNWIEVAIGELPKSIRGSGGFGSTGEH